MVCQSARGHCSLIREKLEKSKSFIIGEWEASTVGLPFLDTFVYLDPNTRKLQTRVHWKPSSLGAPLHYDSLPASHIHMAWIMSEIRRIARCSSNHADFLFGRSEFMSRLRAFYIRCHWLSVMQIMTHTLVISWQLVVGALVEIVHGWLCLTTLLGVLHHFPRPCVPAHPCHGGRVFSKTNGPTPGSKA